MEKRNIIFVIIRALILCGLIWVCLAIARFALDHPNDKQEIFVPESAISVLTLKGDALLTQSLKTLLFNRQDEEQIALILALKEKVKSDESGQRWDFGIDLANDIQLFTDQTDGKDLKGFIFRLNDVNLWDENSSNLLSGSIFSKRIGTTGILLQSKSATKDELVNYFKTHSFSANKLNIPTETITYKYQTKKNQAIKNIDARINFESNHIYAAFSSDFGEEIITGKRKFELDDGGFHIQSSFIPNALSDTLNYFAKKNNLTFPKIRSIDLKYDGIELASSSSGILPLPTIEAIVEFETTFSISVFIEGIAKKDSKLIQFDDKSFVIAKKTYFFKQLDAKTIYIGSTKKPLIFIPKTHNLISISGDPKMLSKIQGSRFLTGLVKMNDSFKKIESILNRLENVDIRVNRKNETQLVGIGKMTFADKRKTMNELVKILLTLI